MPLLRRMKSRPGEGNLRHARIFAALGLVAGLAFAASAWAETPGRSAPSGGPRPRWIIPAHVAFLDQTPNWVSPQISPQISLADPFDTTGILQCVPYARSLSGIGLHGDAWTWWDRAAGIYARGNRPQPGAVLSFPGTERMPLGHVAVVTQILGSRKILIDHANWPNAFVEHGAISRDIQVEDVSPANDWSEVRVQFGEGGPMGSVYPANGFIYGWTDTGVRIAQPRLPADTQDWRRFSATTYFWALPEARRKQAYAAAGAVPPMAAGSRGRTLLVLGLPAGSLLNAGALVQPLGVNRLDVGPRARSGFASARSGMQWATVSR
jgi:surface antigen